MKPTQNKSDQKSSQKKYSALEGMEDIDIIDLIKEEHKPLKELIEVMKGDAKLEEKFLAFEEFAPLLVTHAKPEEQTMYMVMKEEDDTREEGFEGDVEHGLADQLLEEIKRTKEEDLWMARVKVLAELVEHHIEEEEDELLPSYKENSSAEERKELAQEFLKLKEELIAQGGTDSPYEMSLESINRRQSSPEEKDNRH